MVSVRVAFPRRGYCGRCDHLAIVPGWHAPYCLLEDDLGVFRLDDSQFATARAAIEALRLPGDGQMELPGLGRAG